MVPNRRSRLLLAISRVELSKSMADIHDDSMGRYCRLESCVNFLESELSELEDLSLTDDDL